VSETKRCRDALLRRVDLRAYTTVAAMADLDAVRDWLGYEQLDLYGASYGTKAAQVYLKRFPERVRCAVLHGVVPLDTPIELDYATSADATLEAVFRACEADSACHAAYPRLEKEFKALLARKPVKVVDTLSGTPRTLTVDDRLVRDFTQRLLGTAGGIAQLPRILHSAHAEDYRPLARAWLGEGPPPPPAAPRGVFLSILCSEAIPLVKRSSIEVSTRGTFFRGYSIRRQFCECQVWPRAMLSEAFWKPAKAPAPALLLSGELDPITPPRYGEHVAKELENATHLVLPARSHSDLDPCVGRLIESFILLADMSGVDTSCLAAARLRFATPSSQGGEGR
jgi:pimeloyl-ACP methyl ester carboxylesterase